MLNTKLSRILIDASSLRYLYTGLGQFSYHLLQALAALPEKKTELFALVHPRNISLVPREITVEQASWLRRHSPAVLQQFLFKRFDLWHMTTENTRLTGIRSSTKILLTIHGLHFLDEKDEVVAAKMLKEVQALVDKATVITAVSHFTAGLIKEQLQLKGKPLHVIYNGVFVSEKKVRRPSWATEEKFIFSVGTFFKRKNFEVLLPMMEHLSGMKLVLAGDSHQVYGEVIRTQIKKLGLQDRIMMPGEITEEEKNWLYQNGEAFMFPSISEGFGIPVIEAFQYGKPVFIGRYGSLPEIGKSYAHYWENFDPKYMADVVQNKLAEENESGRDQRREYARQFSWRNTASEFLKLYHTILNEPSV